MAFTDKYLHKDFRGDTSSPINSGFCVFCEIHSSDISMHHKNEHGNNYYYTIFLYKYASRYLAPSGIFPDSELNVCDRCDGILYNHRIKNHHCRVPIARFLLDEGRGNEYCLMCQFRCYDVSVHWNEAHKSNAIYKIEEIQGLRTLLPVGTRKVDLKYLSGHENHELCQRLTYKSRIRRPCVHDISISPNSEEIQTNSRSSSGHHEYQDIGLTSQRGNLSQFEGNSANPSLEDNQEILTYGALPQESNNNFQQGSNQNQFQDQHMSYAGPQQSVITPQLPTDFEQDTSNDSSSYYSSYPWHSQIEQESGGSGDFPLQSGNNMQYSANHDQSQQQDGSSSSSAFRYGQENREIGANAMLQVQTYRNGNPCVHDISISPNSEAIQTNSRSSSGHQEHQDIGLTSQRGNLSQFEASSAIPRLEDIQEIGTCGTLPQESNNNFQQRSNPNHYQRTQRTAPQEQHRSYEGPPQSVITPHLPTFFEQGTSTYSSYPLHSQIEQESGGFGDFPLQSGNNMHYL